jgi:hypothetical protein
MADKHTKQTLENMCIGLSSIYAFPIELEIRSVKGNPKRYRFKELRSNQLLTEECY